MSKLNCFRAINLNYNYNTMRIEDESFYFEGESTLMSLQNGGGKSVLVQMMIAPFVRKRYRDTTDRPFASFFTSNRPTFLLTEWVLDGGVGYVLVGMMVRRKQATGEEDSKDELDMVSFIHEYREANDFDIHSIPVIETGGNGKKLKGFNACKVLFEDAKKDKGPSFQYFDINQPVQQRKYFERLKEFQINYTEWETIIKKVNLKESGLSELFKDAKDEAGLIEKWFLPSVESKLNKDENRIKEFAQIIYKFILLYKENQAEIERKQTILSFQLDANDIKERANSFLNAMVDKEEYEEKIAFLRSSLISLWDDKINEKDLIEDQLAVLERDLEMVHFEEASYQLYCFMDERVELEANLKDSHDKKLQSERIINDLIYRINAIECARLYAEYRGFSQGVLLLENQLELLKEQEKDSAPERNQLGFNLRYHYEQTLENHRIYLKELEEQYLLKKEEQKDLSSRENKLHKQIQEQERALGQVQTRVSAYDKEEANYNRRYQEALERNILREYEEGAIELMRLKQQDELESLQISLTQLKNKKEQTDENLISTSRDIEDNSKREGELSLKISHQEKQLEDYEKQVEIRKMILRFIGLGDKDLFKLQELEETFETKLKELGQRKKSLEREKDELEEDFRKLETGKVLELPGEFGELLRNMDLNFVYGMDWLKRNGNSVEKNKALLKKNPMLPYSLIMNEQGLEKLAASTVDFYTSFPIPIIRREDLDALSDRDGGVIYGLDKLSFFVVFNHHLLDEDSLRELLHQKQLQIERLDKLLLQKENELKEYEEKYNVIRYQSITEDKYLSCMKELDGLRQELAGSEENLKALRNKKDELSRLQQDLIDRIDISKQLERTLSNKIKDFAELSASYDEYLGNRDQMEQIKANLEKLRHSLDECKVLLNEASQFIQDAASSRERANIKSEDLQKKVNTYQTYQESEILNKDIEDIEARFEALTKEISENQLQLEERLNKEKERFETKQNQLLKKEAEYNLSELDYRDMIVDDFEELETKKEKASQDGIFKQIEGEYIKLSKDIAVLESKMDSHKNQLEERFQKTELIPRSQIIDLAFKKRCQLIKAVITKEEAQLKLCKERINIYYSNISALAEYDVFATERTFSFEVELEGFEKKALYELSEKDLMEFRGKLVRDYKVSLARLGEKKESLGKNLNSLFHKKVYEEEFFRKPIETMLTISNEAQAVLEQLNIVLGSFEALLEKLEVDIAIVDKEKQKVIEMLLDYIEEIHKNLGKIDRNSSIPVRGRSIKMLRIDLPEWEEQEPIYKIRLQDFIEEITNRGLQRLDLNENIEEMIGAFVTSKNLYDTIVGIGNINIKLYKIEAQREYPISWAEVSKNSGGEGFLSAFVVLSSLLSYMRREDTDIFFEREEGKVLLMDNPFAQTNATHLLKPLMDVAKKNNTQLICLTGLGGESIYNRFDNIYVLNLMGSGLQKDIQYVKGEHIKGDEHILSIRSSQVKVEDIEQMELLF